LFYRLDKNNSTRLRLILMCAALLLAWSGREVLKLYSGQGTEKADPESQDYEYSDDSGNEKNVLSRVTPEKELYPTVEEDLQFVERKRKPGSIADLKHPISKIIPWVASFSSDRIHNEALPRSLWHYENIMREPDYWRMNFMHVYGLLADKNIVEYPDNPPGMKKLFFLTLYDVYAGDYFTVLTPQMPVGAKVHEDSRGGNNSVHGSYLAFDGLFLMNYPYTTLGGNLQETPLFFAPRVWFAREGATPPPLLDGSIYGNRRMDSKGFKIPFKVIPGIDIKFIKSKMYNPPKDGDRNPFYRPMTADLRSEKSVLRHVFQYLYGVEQGEISLRADNPEINYVSLMQGRNAPAWMTGRFTGVTGIALSLDTLHFAEPVDGISRIHLLTVGDTAYKEPGLFTWVVACLELPEGLRQGNRVRAEGLFLKLFPYKTRENTWYWSPLIVSSKVQLLPDSLSPLAPSWLTKENVIWLFIIVGAVIFFVFGWMYFSSIRDNRDLNNILNRSRCAGINLKSKRITKGRKNKSETADNSGGDGE